jgi:hypothetical protein
MPATSDAKLAAEAAADDRTRLGDGLGVTEPIEPRGQGIAQGVGYAERGQRAGEFKAICMLHQRTGLHQVLGEFFDEQRNAVGALEDLLHQLVGQRLAARRLLGDLHRPALLQTAQQQACHMRQIGPSDAILRARRNHQQQCQIGHPRDHARHEFVGGWVDPVRVLAHQQQGLFACALGEQFDQHLLRAPTLLLGTEAERRQQAVGRHRQQLGAERQRGRILAVDRDPAAPAAAPAARLPACRCRCRRRA